MPIRANAFARHQQARWLRPDAARWVRPDAAKFVKPGTRLADVYPALAPVHDATQRQRESEIADAMARERSVLAALHLELAEVRAELARRGAQRKYSPSQPRVSAGNGRQSGRWTDGGVAIGENGLPRVYIGGGDAEADQTGDGGSDTSLPMGSIDFGDIGSEIDSLSLFDITPRERPGGGVQLAGDLPDRLPEIVVTPGDIGASSEPGVGHNGGPPLDELPAIPTQLPDTREARMAFVRNGARVIGRIGRYAPIVNAYFGFLDQLSYLKNQTDMLRTANDPPETYEVLRDRAKEPGKAGYQKHHIVNQHDGNRRKFGNPRIQSSDNIVSVPWLKHIEISRWYQTPNKSEKFGGRSPTDYLRDKDWDEQFREGIEILRKFKVIE